MVKYACHASISDMLLARIPRRCPCRESEASSFLTARALTDQPVSGGLSKYGGVRCGKRVMSLEGKVGKDALQKTLGTLGTQPLINQSWICLWRCSND